MRRLLRPRWLLGHALVLIAVPMFLLLGWWQVRRAAAGNALSFGYALEWPAFAAFVIYVWLREVISTVRRADPDRGDDSTAAGVAGAVPAAVLAAAPARTNRQQPRTGPAYDDSGDPELAAYNHYLAWRNANPDAPARQYPEWRDS